ncbi:flavocytochrome c [Bradyrhizobium sp. LHD-71]|uniref:FAD-dependent oxidoreductase n=1 Tax=Bradyrhizobium sp. LHD-71 TaxID=3072141 RepID=UPI00280D2683|nr:flavocytochrome c [Bradyrhizobium sp. LHD-71]MDQ8729202.1 flavocytochrome c [Bradyrhizobium sp. LHD-71]
MNSEADVVVVGAGLAGFCTAIEAAAQGANTLLLEKMGTVGGSTVLSGGSMAFAGTDDQTSRGIKDSSELLARDLLTVGDYANDPALVKVYADNQLDAYRWLVERGVKYAPVQAAAGQSVPRQHPTDPAEMIRILHREAAAEPRIRIETGRPVARLLRDPVSMRIIGVQLKDGTKVSAQRGVVLTAGGFSRNPEMVEQFAPLQSAAKSVGGPGNVGDGIKMAWHMGAGLRDMAYIKGTFGNRPDARPEEHTAMMAIYKGAIAVNKLGRRFVDESISYKLIGDAVLQQPDHVGYQILDEPIFALGVDGVKMYDFRARLREGSLLKAGSIEELAVKIGVPATALAETVATYNAGVLAGRDEQFARSGLVQGYGELRTIETAPFYAYPSTSALIATYCGVTVDPRMQVLDVFGEPIPGLFAAGEMTGGFHGKAFMTGTSLGKCVICGRIAGRNVALRN